MAKKVNVVLFRGLLGNLYSKGMDALGAKAAKIPNVDYVTVEDYTNWRSVRDRILKWKDPTIIGGHSFGANAATIVAESLDNRVGFPLILSFDPSQHWSWYFFQFGPSYVTRNVARVENYFQYGFPIGGVQLYRNQSGNTDGIHNMPVSSSHTAIDDNPILHDLALDEIRRVVG